MTNILVSTENISHEDWLDYRNLGIGGSDVSVVCGINKWKSPIELWLEKTGQFPPNEVGEAAYWGNRLEDLVREEFTLRTGIEVFPVKQILQSEEYPFMLANLDGICQHPIHGDVIFEAKTSSAYRSGEWEGDSIPDEYILQTQHYMAVTGCRGAYVAVLLGGNNFKWQFVERDEELISMLIKLEQEFWELVQTGIPPALDGSEASAKFLIEHFPDSVPESSIELPDTAIDLVEQYLVACEEIKEHEARKREAENLLKHLLGENEAGVIGGNNGSGGLIVSWKSFSQERIDTKTLKIEHPTLCKKYSNQTTSRRFSIKNVG